jgi:hypothetical protein
MMGNHDLDEYSDERELEELREIAREAFGLDLEEVVRSGSEFNVVGIRSQNVLCSRRLDSRTYFVHDDRYGADLPSGSFAGSEAEQLGVARRILERIGIPADEIHTESVLKEQTQVAEVDSNGGQVRVEAAQPGKQLVRISRIVGSVPVWSSGMSLGVTREGNVGYLQLHWPELPSAAVREAHRLAYMVQHEWRAPEQPLAVVEEVQAGITHSPAIALVLDIVPAIRVIYRPAEGAAGKKKPFHHFDRHGNALAMPRHADLPPAPPLERTQSPTSARA